MSKNGYDRYLDYQYRRSGGFFKALFDAIKVADSDNLPKLAKGFPEEVEAYKTWTRVGVTEFAEKVSPDNPFMDEFKKEYGIDEA